MTTPTEQLVTAVAAGDDTAAEATIEHFGPDDEDALLAALPGADVDTRWWIVYALTRSGSVAAVSHLLPLLADDDAGVRAAAALALPFLFERAPEATWPLLPSVGPLLADDEGFVRQAAADALTQCGDAAVPVLVTALAGVHEGARTRAMAALRKMATIEAAKVMFQHLNDANYLVRSYAYEGLDEMGLLETVLLKP